MTLVLLLILSSSGSVVAQSQTPRFSVVYNVALSQHYSIYGNVVQHVSLTISGEVQTQDAVRFTVQFSFTPGNVSLPHDLWTIKQVRQHPVVNELNVTLPGPMSSFDFTFYGSFQDVGFLYRDSATIPYALVTTNASSILPPPSYTLIIHLTPQTQVFSTFPGPNQGVAVQHVTLQGQDYLVANFPPGKTSFGAFAGEYVVVLYEPPLYNWFLLAYLSLLVILVLFSRQILRTLERLSRKRKDESFRRIRRVVGSLNYKRLLAIFVLMSLFMIGLALVFGPSPTPRVYLAATPQSAQNLGMNISLTGYTYFTPNQAGDEFDTLGNFGAFHAVVIADYPPPVSSLGLASSYHIIVMTNYPQPKGYLTTLQVLYPNAVTTVGSTSQLADVLAAQKLGYTANNLGLHIGTGTYGAVAAVEGVLGLTLPFLALAFLSRYIVEEMGTGVTAIPMVIAWSFFIFLFGEFVYIQTAVLLGIPVALHATISSVETAGGFLGIGGGSRPRLVIGAAGFMFGLLAGKGGAFRFDRIGFLAFVAVVLFIVVDPLTSGQDFYNLALVALTSEPGTSVGVTSYSGLRGFIGSFMNLFGNYLTPTFFSQHGAVLFYVGAVPFALYNYVRRSTSTFLLLFSSVFASVGYVRIGDQEPLKAIASAMPGISLALLLIAAFLGLNYIEGYFRKRLALS